MELKLDTYLIQKRMHGLSDSGLVSAAECALEGHGKDMLLDTHAREAFRALRADAATYGIDLRIISGWRGFPRQLSIWNRKVSGELTVLDASGHAIDRTGMDETALVKAILRWSALPGTSRHHWGSDIDVVDAAVIPPGYEVQLHPSEYSGMFLPMMEYLEHNMHRFGFARPYVAGRGGYSPEPWHLSWQLLAKACELAYDSSQLRNLIMRSGISAQGTILRLLDGIVESHVVAYFDRKLTAEKV